MSGRELPEFIATGGWVDRHHNQIAKDSFIGDRSK